MAQATLPRSINEFISNIRGGLTPSNMYVVEILEGGIESPKAGFGSFAGVESLLSSDALSFTSNQTLNNLANQTAQDVLNTGLSRVNDFTSTFMNFANVLSGDTQIVSMLCKGAQIPFLTFNEGGYFYNDYFKNFPSALDYDPITLQYYVDNDMNVLNYWVEWLEKVVPTNTTKGKFEYKSKYARSINIHLIDKEMNILFTCNLEKCYPTNVSTIDLGYDNSELINFGVSLKYDWASYKVYSKGSNVFDIIKNAKDVARDTLSNVRNVRTDYNNMKRDVQAALTKEVI